VAIAAVPQKLRTLLAANRDLAVVINADREVAHARVVDVLDELRGSGVTRIAIAVVPEGGQVRR